MKERQLEEIRKRSGGYMTASECLVAVPEAYPHIDIEKHMEWVLPHLCGPFGRVMS